jgi:predicted GNAT family acetyltransferase
MSNENECNKNFIALKKSKMAIKHREGTHHNRFYVENEGKVAAEMVYEMTNDTTMTILHTEVDDSLRGKSVGLKLVTHAVEYAREKGLKIIPECSFAAAIFQKKPEFKDVLADPL